MLDSSVFWNMSLGYCQNRRAMNSDKKIFPSLPFPPLLKKKGVLGFFSLLFLFAPYENLYAQCRVLYEAGQEEVILSHVKWKFSVTSPRGNAIRVTTSDVNWKDASLSQEWESLSDPEKGIWYRCFVHLNGEPPQNMALYLRKNEVADKVFFNGTFLGSTGDASKHRYDHTTERLYSIPQRLWQNGSNLISIHLSGTSVYTSGVQKVSVVKEGPMARKIILKDIPKIIFCAAYLLLAVLISLFHFFTKQKESLYLSLFAFSLGMHNLLQTWLRSEIVSSFTLSYFIQRLFLFACPPLFLAYLQSVHKKKQNRYSYAFYALSALLVILLILLPSHPEVWSYLSKINVVLIFPLVFYTVWLFWYTKEFKTNTYLKTACIILLLCVSWDIFATLNIPSLPRLTPLAFLLFICSAFIEIGRSIIALFNDMMANEKQVRLVEKRKTHSIYNMSREFEKHLNNLSELVSSLARNKAKVISKGDKVSMENSIIGLESLTNDSEKLRKLESGIYIHRQSAIDIRELCRKVIQRTLLTTQQSKARVHLKIDRKISMLMSDAETLSLALYHLLKNALIYTEGKVECKIEKTEDNEIKFEVVDEGPGIDTGETKQVFQKFSRAVEPHSKINGLGIGLTLVSLIVKSLDGRIEFNNNHGFFSIFTFYIPLN